MTELSETIPLASIIFENKSFFSNLTTLPKFQIELLRTKKTIIYVGVI